MRLSDKFTTGSSIMPQKRNPDAAELVRAKTGRIAGAFQTLLMVMKGLPLAYAKDMQEDKEPLFDALDALKLAARRHDGNGRGPRARPRGHERGGRLRAIRPRPTSPTGSCSKLGLPFRDAHHITGRIVALADAKGVELKGLSLADLQSVEPKITKEAFQALDVAGSVKSRKSYGGTAPANVRAEAKRWIKRLEKEGLSRKKG